VSRPASHILVAVIAVAVPLVITGTAVIALFQPWIVQAQYSLPGFPADPGGAKSGSGDPSGGGRSGAGSGEAAVITTAERTELAETGVRSVAPLGPGTGLLREARLPDGAAAFSPREIAHMEDVRDLTRSIAALWLFALAAGLVAGLSLRRAGYAGRVRAGLRLGALATLAAVAVTGLAMLVSFGTIFDRFHELFFAPESWQFATDDTLIRLYPEAFWALGSAALVTLILLQAAVCLAVTRAPGRACAA